MKDDKGMPRVQPPESCNVYTPPRLADAIVSRIATDEESTWLEPCVGQGAFLTALHAHGVPAHCITGIDLASCCEPTDEFAQVSRSTEFLNWAAQREATFDRVVANPPFIALSKLPEEIRLAACRHRVPYGAPVTLGSNCWFAFLCASLRLLRPGGSLAFVLPAAFEYANYARQLREQLPSLFGQCEIHRSRVPLFDSVGEGSVVLLGSDYQANSRHSLRSEYDTINEMLIGLAKPIRRRASVTPTNSAPRHFRRLCDVMTIGIGAVTGDARYFLLTESERILHELPTSAMRPIVSKAKHIQAASITSEHWNNLRDNDERVWLFYPRDETLHRSAVKRYLERDVDNGGCRKDAYKVRIRDPWYLTPLPQKPHGFLSGMTRTSPFICFNQKRDLSASNTLYTVHFNGDVNEEQRNAWALMLLTSPVREQLQAIKRDYALGLSKIEPGDMKSLVLPTPTLGAVTERVYREAVTLLLDGEQEASRGLADRFISD